MNCRPPSAAAIVAFMLLAFSDAAIAKPDSVLLENGSQEQTAGIYFGPIRIDVRSGPRGGNPRGDVAFLISGLQIRAGTATCLRVRHRSATIGFVDGGSGLPPSVVTVQVRDGVTDSFDAAIGVRGPNNCHRLRPTGERAPLTSGELEVVDVRPGRHRGRDRLPAGSGLRRGETVDVATRTTPDCSTGAGLVQSASACFSAFR